MKKYFYKAREGITDKKVFAFLFSAYFILASFRGIIPLIPISNLAVIFALAFLIFLAPEIKKDKLLLNLVILINAFNFWAILTSFWSLNADVSFIRGVLLFINSNGLLLGGYFYSKSVISNSWNISDKIKYLLPLNVFLIFIGLSSLISGIPSDAWSGYGFGFKSFFSHQNMYGSLLAFTIPAILFITRINKRRIILWGILLFCNIMLMMMSHSRTSFLAVLIFVIIDLLLGFNKQKILLASLVVIILFLIISFNSNIRSDFKHYFKKTEVSLLDRKKPVIYGSFRAAKDGNIVGLGYGVSNPKVVLDPYFWHMEGKRMVREKGVSIFALVEETGIVGLFLFLMALVYILFYLLKLSNSEGRLVFAFLIAISIHAQLEAMWVGTASVQLMIFYALMGTAVSLNRNKNENTLPV